jgi:ornithine carbamoyltransferase
LDHAPVLVSSPPAMKQKHLVSLRDYSGADILEILDLARRMKADPGAWRETLRGRILAMIFQKASTRTRVSFEAGMYQLGGHAMNLAGGDIQMRRGETVADTARVLSRYVDGIMARVFAHEDLEERARYATIPIINGLSDLSHPVQALADFMTLLDRRGTLEGAKVAYVGDGNNVCHSLMLAAAKLGVHMAVAAPAGYDPSPVIAAAAARAAEEAGTPAAMVTRDPMEAVVGADVVYTDVWTSMGQEAESAARVSAFQGYMVTTEMMSAAARDAVFMHCLPAHRGEEVAAEVMDGPRSVVFDQAENRLHAQKAVLALLIGGPVDGGPPRA